MKRRLLAAAIATAAALAVGPVRAADPVYQITRGSIVSFDATRIVYNLFLPDASINPPTWPIIFMGHGWGGSGQTAATGIVKTLLDRGYAVMTWDSRGFGQSGGDAYVDDPGHEVRDVSALIDLVAHRSDILHDRRNDPRMGMIGGSYAGGIQLATAAFDRRVDALVPQITWNDLRYSLFPNGVIKFGFDQLLYGSGLATALSGGISASATAGPQTGAYSTDIHMSELKGTINGYADDDTLAWFAGRSVAGYGFGHPVNVPTLLVQGNTDALFNINEAVANWHHVADRRVPAKLMIFCGGHVACPSNYSTAGMNDHLLAAELAWFDKYVKKTADIDTGAPVEYMTNDAVWHSVSKFENAASSHRTVTASGSLLNTGAKTSIINGSIANAGLSGIEAATPSDPRDPGTLTVNTGLAGGDTIVGIPTATLTVTGVGAGVHLFLKLVDREANQVVDLQEAAIRIVGLSDAPKTLSLDMVGVDYVVPEGHHIDLQVSTSSSAMLEFRGPSAVTLAAEVSVPVL